MEWRGFLRVGVPLLFVFGLILSLPSIPGANRALELLSSGPTDYGLTTLPPILPQGIEDLTAAAGGDEGVIVAGMNSADRAIVASYDPVADTLDWSLEMPPYYAQIDRLVAGPTQVVVAGKSVGTSPVLGIYQPSSGTFRDLSDLLPTEALSIRDLIGASVPLVVSSEPAGQRLYLLNPETSSLVSVSDSRLDALTFLAGVWNGSAFYLAGESAPGALGLYVLNQDGDVIGNLTFALPDDLGTIDGLVWGPERLYLLGHRVRYGRSWATLASIDPHSGAGALLSGGLRTDFFRFHHGVWNGTHLLLHGTALIFPRLLTFTPTDGEFQYPGGLPLTDPNPVALLLFRNDLLIIRGRGQPSIARLETTGWNWEERLGIFEGPFQAIHAVIPVSDRLLLAGERGASAALGFVDVDRPAVEDLSEALHLIGVSLHGVVEDGPLLRIVGSRGGTGLLLEYNLTSHLMEDRSDRLPRPSQRLTSIVRSGDLDLLLGDETTGPVAFAYDAARNRTLDLTPKARLSFATIHGAAPLDGGFLLVGQNQFGPALAEIDPAGTGVHLIAGPLGRLYGPTGVFRAVDGSGDELLLGGQQGTRALLGAWSPTSGGYRDVSSRLPSQFGGVTHIEFAGEAYVLAGQNETGPTLAAYYPANDTAVDLSPLLPPGSVRVEGVAPLRGAIFVVTRDGSSVATISKLDVKGSSPLDLLPLPFRDVGGLLFLGIAIFVTAVLAFMVGRRRPRAAHTLPPPPPLPEIEVEPLEDYGWGYAPPDRGPPPPGFP